MGNIAATHRIITTEVILWEIQNGEFDFSMFVDNFPMVYFRVYLCFNDDVWTCITKVFLNDNHFSF